MLPSQNILTVAAAIVLACCSVVEGGNDPYLVPDCNTPYCGPCVPERVNFGYFPTTWRRWPTGSAESVAGPQPEALPSPAEPAIPEAPLEPTQPDAAGPEQPDVVPLEPPFGEGPARPPTDQSPIQLPFGEEPPPFDDAPPALPTEPKDSSLPSFDPTKAPEPTPSVDLPKARRSPVPDSDLPPTMPDDDPFKDDPQQDIGLPAEPAPKSSAHDELDRIRQQASIHWQRTAEPPGMLHESPALSLPDRNEPGRMETDDTEVQSPLLPGRRDNPLRSASRTIRPAGIVPAASFTAADTATTAGRDVRWRRNPLRSN